MTIASDINDLFSGITLRSYYQTPRTAEEMRTDLAGLRSGLDTFQPVANGFIGFSAPEIVQASDPALEALASYAAEADAAARQQFAETAIAAADQALRDMTSLIRVEKNVSSPQALAYGFGALHYVVLLRQFVADTVQDGPLGAPGLYEQITTATKLMYDEILANSGGEGLFVAMVNRINRDIEAVDIQGTRADPTVAFTVISDLAEIARRFEAEVPSGLSEEEFEQVLANTIEQQVGVVALDVLDEAGVAFMQVVGQLQNTYLPATAGEVAGTYERIGTEGADTEDGSALAEYMQGLAGDDLLNGFGGPDVLSGGLGNDILRGGAFRDMLVGGEGNDLIFGAEARSEATVAPDGDTARFFGLSTEYEILGGSDYAVVTAPDGSRDKLFDVSFLRFDDLDITLTAGSALDQEGDFAKLDKTNFVTAERVALLYEAALDRNGAIDLPGLNFYIQVTERDALTDEFLAADLMTSPEFTEKFGDVNTLTNTQFLERIYENVLNRTPDAAGLQFYLDLLNAETISRALALADISVSPENTQGSLEILMSLYESTTPVLDTGTNVEIAWSFVA